VTAAPTHTIRRTLEGLEDRTLMAAALTASLSGGVLRIEGTERGDRIVVREQGGRLAIDNATIRINGQSVCSVSAGSVCGIEVRARGGDDLVSLAQTGQVVSKPATVWAGDGRNTVYGGSGDDRLYADGGGSYLHGNGGDDALFGRSYDLLYGGAGADRFLNAGGASATDATAADARIYFRSGDKTWTPAEVAAVDEGLARLTAATHNTRLLKLSDGSPLTFVRERMLANDRNTLGDSDDRGTIRITDASFRRGYDTWRTVVHEVGHNWDEPSENRFAATFRAQSGWHTGHRRGDVQSTDGNWWYSPAATFACDYGRTNPLEDFATSVEVAFGARPEQPIHGKLSILRQWLASLAAAPTTADVAPAAPARDAAAPAPDGLGQRMIESVVTVRNATGTTLSYQIAWVGGSWQSVTLRPGANWMVWTAGANRTAVIRFDGSAAAGYQEVRYNLASKDFVAGGPANWRPYYQSDGMIFDFVVNAARTGWTLTGYYGLDTSRYAAERAKVSGFPGLAGGRFEVLSASTPHPDSNGGIVDGTYNCIAWSLGEVNHWVNPVTSAGSNPLAGMDQLYAAKGYHRVNGLDYRLQAGVQKVVVYARVSNGWITDVTHAALQMGDGSWTSKLGGQPLIRHLSPDDLDGDAYGRPVAVYVRYA
jgi:RTX calcium-binding nonapeptide repeat (4 copies)